MVDLLHKELFLLLQLSYLVYKLYYVNKKRTNIYVWYQQITKGEVERNEQG